MSDNTQANVGASGDLFATDELTTINGGGAPAGLKVIRNKVCFGDDGDARDASEAFPLPVKGSTLTKGTQASTGFSVQALKDAGRSIVNAATAIAGVTTVAAEALLAMDVSRAGAATASETTHAVTAAKRWRITAIVVGLRNDGAAVVSARVSLRFNPSGVALVTSPIITTAALSSGPATAQMGNEITIPIPDGVEFSGANQWALTHIANSTGGTLWASAIGYEY